MTPKLARARHFRLRTRGPLEFHLNDFHLIIHLIIHLKIILLTFLGIYSHNTLA